MASKSIFKFDTSLLEQATRELAKENGKDLAKAFNKKMGWLLRRWLWLTPKSNYNKIVRQLGLQRKLYQSGEKVTKKGTLKFKGGWKIKGVAKKGNITTSGGESLPLIYALVSKRKKGSPFKGKTRKQGAKAMGIAVKKKYLARIRSIGYLKSGIASAQKPFLPFSSGGTQMPPEDNKQMKPTGRPKGFGTIASPGNRVLAVALSKTGTRRQGDRGLMRFALPALQKAYDIELADTVNYLEGELKKTARRLGVKTK